MKPDKFDEAIRRKLEGIQPGFQDEDWAKFKAFQNTRIPTSFLQRYGRSMLYTAASVTAAVMVFANVYQYRQNRTLDQQVAHLKTQLGQRENVPVRVSTRVDTVYITKYISVQPQQPQPDAYAQALPPSNENELLTDGNAAEGAAAVSKGLKNIGKMIRQNPNERISEAFERPTSIEPETSGAKERKSLSSTSGPAKSTFSPKERNSTATTQNAAPERTIENSGRSTASAEQSNELVTGNIPTPEQTGLGKEETEGTGTATTADNFPSKINELNPLEANPMVELEGLQPAEVRVKRYAYATLQSQSAQAATGEAKATPPPSISFKNVRFRIGGSMNIGDKYTGYNLMSSVLLGKYWSLDVGIGKAKITGPEYFTEAVFNTKTGRPFQAWHKGDNVRPPLIPPQIFDIKTEASLIRLPLSLTYRWPIKENFTLLFSGGTNLNLSAQQYYRFFYKERNDNFEEKEGKFGIKPAISNDIMVAAGVEKQWRRIAFQVEAYAAPYLQKPAYLTDNRNLGVRFKVLYQFGKKQI
ncbi:hypothetical protein [Runella slithyformis]|uniref:Outer membrane protein beta-barrel domain-containing protein n=1 Tax=Runella slithyformis (strain ATCC 29530 / DSM 19594 / LMG 11500 / NCIMB 11436 / LSU 4) TaxID=761193 RepID=A0A7U3ZMA7_RUNSL|nr:hypothetical protein [Runella slithyformis]AEI49840.1 hypothetical protein Runsl_3476 [Runella slithyformis DSM 19594]